MYQQEYQKCIDACIECATVCNHCAVSCLEEKDVQYLTKCIRLNLECAVICRAAAELVSIDSRYSKEVCQLCAIICDACAQICEQHANMGMEHCRECMEACRACAKETMEVHQKVEKQYVQTNGADQQFVHHDECAVISRATAELLSLGSSYSKEITRLNASICDASAKQFEKHVNIGMERLRRHASTATEAYEDLENHGQKVMEADQQKPDEEYSKVPDNDVANKKKKHSSALLAASLWRSPTGHSLLHVNRDVRGSSGLANTGTIITY